MFGIPNTWKVFYFLFVCLFVFVFFVFVFLFFVFCFFFVLFLFCFVLFFVFVFVEEKTWKVKCYSLPFFLLAICNGKYLHRIEHTKWIKQGQDCQKVIANKSLRIYIYIYIYMFLYHLCFLSLWSARFLQSWKCVV